jgi:translation initiation factor IF-3
MKLTRRSPISGPFERKGFGGGPGASRGGDFKNKKQEKDGLRVNREIRAPQIRVIDDQGQMLGVMTVMEGVRIAEDRGLDLIEIAPTATPPTCKIMDYGKWKYENKKKQVAARKNQVIVQVKEIQIRPRTDQHDLETKMKHARRFILEGDKVKVNMRFLGRELAHQDLGMALMHKVVDTLKDVAMAEAPPKMEGKQAFLILAPDPVKVKEYLKLHPKPQAPANDEEESADDDE